MSESAQITFTRHAATFLRSLRVRRRKKVKDTSVAAFRSAIKMSIPVLGRKPIGTIESSDLRALVDYLDNENYAANTIRLVVRTAKKVIASVVDEKGNPLIVKTWNDDFIDVPHVPERDKEALKAEQVEDAIARAPKIIREIVITQAATGCRIGELMALNVTDFDAVANVLHVRATKGNYTRQLPGGVSTPKTASGIRDIDLHPSIARVLQRMLAGRTDGPLFDISIHKVRRAVKAAGLKSHDLRHFRYTHLKDAVPGTILNSWIGHSLPGMAKVYDHSAEDTERRRVLASKVGIGFNLAAPR